MDSSNAFLSDFLNISQEEVEEFFQHEEIKNKFKYLRDLHTDLTDKIQKEEKFQRDFEQMSDLKERQCNERREYIQTLKNRLTEAAIQDAKYSTNHSQNPIIFQVESLAGHTSFVGINRLRAKVLQLKLKYEKNLIELEKCRNNAFCLDSTDDMMNYRVYEENDAHISDWTLPIQFSDTLSESISDSNFSVPQIGALAETHDIIESVNDQSTTFVSLPFQTKTFQSHSISLQQQNQMKINSLISDYFSFYDTQNTILNEKMEQMRSIQDEISQIDQHKNEFTQTIASRIRNHLKELQGQRFALCSEAISLAQNQIMTSQNVIDSLSQYIHLNDQNERNIIANDSQIKQMILQISNDIKQIADRTKRMSLSQQFEPIQFGKAEPLVVNEISHTQIQKCKKHIEELEKAFDISYKFQDVAIDDLRTMIKNIGSMFDNQLKLPEINDPDPVVSINPERRARLNQIKKKILEKQQNQLSMIKEMIDSLPESIKDIQIINNNEENIQNADETNKQAEQSQLIQPTQENDIYIKQSDPFSEANSVIIQRLLQKDIKPQEEAIPLPAETVYTPENETNKLVDKLSKKLAVETMDYDSVIQEKEEIEKRLSEIIESNTTRSERKIAMHEAKEKRMREIEILQENLQETRKRKEKIDQNLSRAVKILNQKKQDFDKLVEEKAEKEREIQQLKEQCNKRDQLQEELENLRQERSRFIEENEKEIQQIKEQLK